MPIGIHNIVDYDHSSAGRIRDPASGAIQPNAPLRQGEEAATYWDECAASAVAGGGKKPPPANDKSASGRKARNDRNNKPIRGEFRFGRGDRP